MTPPAAILGIGTASFLANYGLPAAGSRPVPGAAPGDDVLRAALAGGVRYLDTAADYGDSERAVGRVLRAGVRVCTKMGAGGSLANIRTSVERLGTRPDTVLMHSAAREQIASGAAIAALRDAKESGLTSRIGASTYGAADAAFALAQPWVDVVQVEYSILNQSVVRSISRARPGQEIVVRSVLCKGLLTSRRQAAPQLVAQVDDALGGIEECAREWDMSLETLAIRFALDSRGVDVVLVGVSTREELDAALAAWSARPLTQAQWDHVAGFDRSGADATHPERWERIS